MTDQHGGLEESLDIDDLGDQDAVAVVHAGKEIHFFLTVRYCPDHQYYAVRLNDEDNHILGGADTQDEALVLADTYIAGYLHARSDPKPHVDRVVLNVVTLHTPTHLEDLRN